MAVDRTLFDGSDLVTRRPPAPAARQSIRQEAEAAMARAEKGAGRAWMHLAATAIEWVARHQAEFTTDDVWVRIGATGDPRAIGPAMKRAQAAGLVEPTFEYRPSTRIECHGRPVRVWRSKVFCR